MRSGPCFEERPCRLMSWSRRSAQRPTLFVWWNGTIRRAKRWALIVAILALATVLRVRGIGLDSLSGDEVLSLMNGYLDSDAVHERMPEYITAPALGARAGVLGAIALAETT